MEHVIRVGEAWSKCHDLHRSRIFWALELLNTIQIAKEWSSAEICTGPFLGGRQSAVCECWCTHEPLLAPCLSSSQGDFDRFMLFSGFLISI